MLVEAAYGPLVQARVVCLALATILSEDVPVAVELGGGLEG